MLAAAAAVLAVAGVVWGANLGRPALVAAPTPAPTGRTTPTPTATPSGPVTASAAPSSAWPTPTLSCSDFRAAWRAAFASRIDFPPSAGRDPVLVGVDGERELVEGTVAGERLVQDFPDGLAGVPRRLTTLPDGAFFAAPVIQRDRILFVVLDAGMSARGPWRLFLAEGGAAPRIVLSGDSHTERPPLYPVWMVGDQLTWIAATGETTIPPPLVVRQLDLATAGANPVDVRELGERNWALTDSFLLAWTEDRDLTAFDRESLALVATPPGFGDVLSTLAVDGDRLLYTSQLSYRANDPTTVLRLLDLKAGTVQDVLTLDGELSHAMMSGDLALVAPVDESRLLVDLRSGNAIELVGSTAGRLDGFDISLRGGSLSITRSEEARGIVHTVGSVDLAALPTVVPPNC